MESFKRELVDLLKKYPDIESISFKQSFTVTKDTHLDSKSIPLGIPKELELAESKPSYVSPQDQALTQAEQTMQALKSRAGIKVTE